MQEMTTKRLILPARRQVVHLWLEALCARNPIWEREAFERSALHALADFYCFLDEKCRPGLFRLDDLLATSTAPEKLAFLDVARIFLTLRAAFRRALLTYETETQLTLLESLDDWSEAVIKPYSETRSQQLLQQKGEIVQRMAELNLLNHCATALSATLDPVSVYQASAHLARLLTNADLCIVFQKVDDYLWPQASAGDLRYSCKPIRISNPQLLDLMLVDQEHKDVSIQVVRRILGMPTAQAIASTPLRVGDHVVGSLVSVYNQAQTITLHQLRLQEIFASHAAQAIDNAQLYERLANLTAAQERQRIACEMHDTMLQTLVSLNITLQVALGHVHHERWLQARAVIEEARQLGRLAMQEGRETLNRLRSEGSSREDLIGCLQPELTLFSELSGVTPHLIVDDEGEALLVSKEVGHHLRRLVGEALTNIYRHACATEVTVVVGRHDQELWLDIRDNGVGFVPDSVDQSSSFGLTGMRERARFIDGQLEVQSVVGQGTVIHIRVPCRHVALPENQTFAD